MYLLHDPLLLEPLYSYYFFFFHLSPSPPYLHSFPTRRSSDLSSFSPGKASVPPAILSGTAIRSRSASKKIGSGLDRKSTRLNSSHVSISYAVFCLKKKK